MSFKNYIAFITFAIVFVLLKFTPFQTAGFSIFNTVQSTLIYLIGFIITMYFSFPFLRKEWKDFKHHPWFKYLFIAGSFLLMFVILKIVRLVLFNEQPSPLPEEEIAPVHNTLPMYVLLLGSIPPLLAPFYEELAFRNNLFYTFRHKKIIALLMAVLSSILFGAIHYYNFNSIRSTIPYMFIGLYFCLIYFYKKNIYYTIIPHLLLNWMNICLSILGYFIL